MGNGDSIGGTGRARPYDLRWGTPGQVKRAFGVKPAVLKAAWKKGWVRARQVAWKDDGRRTQTVFSFEDVQVWLEEAAHRPSGEYAKKWWTDAKIAEAAEKMPVKDRGISAAAQRGEARGATAPHPEKTRGFYFDFTNKKEDQG